jgi:hypothetical protein
MMRVLTKFSGFGPSWVNVTNWLGSPEDSTAAQAAVTAIGAFWNSVDAVRSSGSVWTTDPVVTVFDDSNGQTTGTHTTTPVTGTGDVGGDPMPLQDQLVVHLRTGTYVAGREIRGRIFIPALTENANTTGGVPLAATITTVLNAATTLNAVSSPCAIGVYSPTHNSGFLVQAVTVPTKWFVLRSRRT